MKKFTTVQEISDERKHQRENPVVYTLLGTIIGEIDRLPIPRTEKPSEDQIYKIIKKMHDSVADMLSYNSDNAQYQEEYNYLKDFIRVQLSESELEIIVSDFILGNSTAKMGDIMKHLKDNYAGQYDGKLASKVVNFILNRK